MFRPLSSHPQAVKTH